MLEKQLKTFAQADKGFGIKKFENKVAKIDFDVLKKKKKKRTVSLNSKFISSYKKECISSCMFKLSSSLINY